MAASDARAVTLALLAKRSAEASICPSEVARALAADAGREDWRAEMAKVHAAVEQLTMDKLVRLSWQGAPRMAGEGPYRIRRGET